MNIWLPYPDYEGTSRVLSDTDLREQVLHIAHALDVLHQNVVDPDNWNHPVVKAWRGHEAQLAEFGIICAWQINARGEFPPYGERFFETHQEAASSGNLLKPGWFGDAHVHDSHKSALLRRNLAHYEMYFSGVGNMLDLLWAS